VLIGNLFLEWASTWGSREFGYDAAAMRVLENGRPAAAPSVVDATNAAAGAAVELKPFGVNVCGHIRSEKGIGEAVRGQIRSLGRVRVPVALNDFADCTAKNLDDEFTALSEENPYAANLIHLNADALKACFELKTKQYFQDHYNIGYWVWETPAFPAKWWDRFQYLDEVWVTSDFVLDAISRVSPIPVVKVPLAIPDRMEVVALPRAHFELPAGGFMFLFVFDFMSVVQRKNPSGLVQAFHQAFDKRDDVFLVIKCAHSEGYPDEMARLRRSCQDSRVRIIDGVLSREQTVALMKAADCYVSLHRSEGFGLTMAEAMSLAKPVIATAYSGNMEYMTPGNSFLVKYTLTGIDGEYGPYKTGVWAEPDLEHAAELMLSCV
jgi:glycosyltransferase involved in cell wall biosynthesis